MSNNQTQAIVTAIRAAVAQYELDDNIMPVRVHGNVVGLPAWCDGMMYWPAIALVTHPNGQVSVRRKVFDEGDGHRETRAFDTVDAAVVWALTVD